MDPIPTIGKFKAKSIVFKHGLHANSSFCILFVSSTRALATVPGRNLLKLHGVRRQSGSGDGAFRTVAQKPPRRSA
jgi:hypothetical protein